MSAMPPRQWAAIILKTPTLAKRREILGKAPEHLQELIKSHVLNAKALEKHRRGPHENQ